MRRFTLICSAALLAACTKSENPPATDTGMAAATDTGMAAAPAPGPIALSDVAGKWAVTSTNDTTVVHYELNATADTTGWTMTFPNRKPIPMRIVAIAGDSIEIDAGPFESVIRKGVMVRNHGAFRLRDGKLVGRTVARYNTKGPDTVRVFIQEGVRK